MARRALKSWLGATSGAAAIEQALIAATVSAAIISAIDSTGSYSSGAFDTLSDAMSVEQRTSNLSPERAQDPASSSSSSSAGNADDSPYRQAEREREAEQARQAANNDDGSLLSVSVSVDIGL